jgi:hypothetical protein
MGKKEECFDRNLSGILVQQRISDGYINATKLAKAYEMQTGIRKDVGNWLITERAKSNISYTSSKTGIPWLHPKIATPFATWLSVEFEYQVTEWLEEWMTTGKNPIYDRLDLDRVIYRDALKDEARIRMTDQVKLYLEQIQRYDDKQYSGQFFARVHDAINICITTETSKQMRERISQMLGKKVNNNNELIRDYFPAMPLQRYISVCEAAANFMLRENLHPLTAVERAIEIVLPADYMPQPINFAEDIKFVRRRISEPVILPQNPLDGRNFLS